RFRGLMIERESIAPLLDNSTLEDEVHALGAEILAELSAPSNTIFNPDYYTERFLSWAMADEEVKVSLFRFVDVLPSLPDSAAVIRHVQEYFHPLKGKLPDLLLKALNLS